MATSLELMKPMKSHYEVVDNIAMAIPEKSTILNGGSEGVMITERYANDHVRITELVFTNHSFIPKHKHPHYCIVKVLGGTIVDLINGDVMESGEMVLYRPDQMHNAISPAGARVIVFNTSNKEVARNILQQGDYYFKGKKVQYQLNPLSFNLNSAL